MLNKTTLALAASIALGASLSGCSLAPDFLRPAAPVAANWEGKVAGTRSIDQTPWREFFPDARLQALIEAAFEHNRDLRIAVARVDEARGLYGVQRADRLPGLNVSGSQTAARTPGSVSTTGNLLYTRRYDGGLALPAFEIDFWGRVANLSEAARASYLATEEAQRSFRLGLIADVAASYFSFLEMDERTQIARATVAARQEGRDILAKRREVGIAGELDYLQADGALELAKADLASLERQRAAAYNALVLLVGKPGLDAQLAGHGTLAAQAVSADLRVDLPTEVIVRRPDIMAAEQKLVAANANIGAARAAFLPKLILAGSVGSAARTLGGLFDSGTGAWSFTPSLTMPLFDWGRTSANLDVAEVRKVIAVAEYEKAIQQAFREIADLIVAREQLGQQLTALEAAEKAQLGRLRLAEARYNAGISNYLEVLDAQRDAYSAQQNTVQTRRLLLTTAASLYKALGGGEAPPNLAARGGEAPPSSSTRGGEAPAEGKPAA